MFRLAILDQRDIAASVGGGLTNMLSCDNCGADLDLHDRLVVEVKVDQKVVDGEEVDEIVGFRIVGCDRKPRTWRMWARRQEKVVDGREFLNFGREAHVRRATQIGEPVAVELTEDPEGAYWGWIACHHRDGHDGTPTLIQPHPAGFRTQFTYDPDREQERGRGEIVRLSVRATT